MEAPQQRRNRVYKSLHRPLTYLGIERTLFMLSVLAGIVCFNLFDSMLAGAIVAAAGLLFGWWATGKDPAFLRIIGRSHRLRTRYDAAKYDAPRMEIK